MRDEDGAVALEPPPGELVAEGPDIETVSLVSDASWRTISGSASIPAGWQTNLFYDDSDSAGWTNAVVDVANRIWHTSGSSSSGPSTARFRKIVHLPRKVRAAHAVFAADDDGDFFVNGTLVLHDASGGASTAVLELDPNLLTPGDNLLAAFGQDVVASTHVIAVEIVLQLEPEPELQVAGVAGMASPQITVRGLDVNRGYVLARSTNAPAADVWQPEVSFTALHFTTNWTAAITGAPGAALFRLEQPPGP